MEEKKLTRSLGFYDATMLVAGSMIGSGIFLVTADMARDVGSAGWILALWLITGVITVAAALSYGELAGMMPNAGGQYVYLRRAYNPLVAFTYGWTVFTVIQTGVIAAVAVAFANYTSVFFEGLQTVIYKTDYQIGGEKYFYTLKYTQLLALASVILLTWSNSRGIRNGKIIQSVFTSAKIIALLALIVLGIGVGMGSEAASINFQDPWKATKTFFDSGTQSWVTEPLMGIALVGMLGSTIINPLFSSDAWNNVTFISAEIKDPKRNLPRSLFFGTLIVTVLYFLANLAYVLLLPVKGSPEGADVLSQGMQFAEQGRVGTAAASLILGNTAIAFMAVLIMVSTFGCNNGLTLAGARVYYAMANDGLFFKKAGKLNDRQVPGIALWAQCIWASVLCLSGTYGALLTYSTFAALVFYIITIAGLFILRKKEPLTERPYKAFGYPIVPAFYIAIATAICLDLLYFQTLATGIGLGIVLLGVPVYFMTRKGLSRPD